MPQLRMMLRALVVAAAIGSVVAGCTTEDLVREADLQTGGKLRKSQDVESDRSRCPRASYWEMSRQR